MGKDILPTQQLACTATICEIKQSRGDETKVAYLHSKGKSSCQRIDLVADEQQEFKDLKEYIKMLDIDDESPYEKIEICWPFDILKVLQWKLKFYYCFKDTESDIGSC